MGSHCQTPATSFSGGNFSLPRQWRRAAFAGQMMLGAELLLPMEKAIWLLSSHSPSFAWRARFNLHYGESVAYFPCSSSTDNRSVAVSVQIGIIPSLPPARLCRVHSTFASDDRNRSPIGRAPIHSLVLPSLSFGTQTDGKKEGPEGECTTNEAHPEHALPSLPASLGRDPRHHVLSLAATQCISDRFRLYSDI